MKTYHHFFILLFFTNVLFAQYNVSVKQPLNEVPIKFHRDHFNLKGDVKVFNNSIVKYTFNEQGFLIREKGLFSHITEYTYDANSNLLFVTSDAASLSPLKYEITNDNKGRPVEKKYGISVETYEYDSNGNYFKTYDSNYGKLILKELNEYDHKNRLVKHQYFFDNEEAFNSVYSYKIEGDFIKITQIHTSKNEEPRTKTFYYKNGNYYGENRSDNLTFDKYGNPMSLIGSDGMPSMEIKYSYFSDKESIIEDDCCLSGNCQNGWGTRKFGGNVYEGFWKDGLKDGFGTYKWNDGSKYSGNWTVDKMSGLGHFFKGDTYEIVGEFKNNKFDGFAIIKDNEKISYVIYKEGILEKEINLTSNSDGTGCKSGNCKDGIGLYRWESGNVFLGKWKNGKQFFGVTIFSDGSVYIGNIDENGNLTNIGEYTFSSGNIYFGEWKNGVYNGRGYYYYKETKEEFIGLWENGVLKTSFKD